MLVGGARLSSFLNKDLGLKAVLKAVLSDFVGTGVNAGGGSLIGF